MRIALAVATVAVALAGCGGAPSSDPPPTSANPTPPPKVAESPSPDSFALGDTMKQNFIVVQTSRPKAFKPESPDGPGRHFYVTLNVKNDSLNTYDISHEISVSASAGGSECEFSYDEASGVLLAPLTPVRPGKSVTFKDGFRCPAAAGSELTVAIGAIAGSDPTVFTGKLP